MNTPTLYYTKVGSSYQVVRDFKIQTEILGLTACSDLYCLTADGMLYIYKWYAWDGPTGGWNTDSFVKASCVHDVLCEMINEGILPRSTQPLADGEMHKINHDAGMWLPRVIWTYGAVRFYQAHKKYITGKRQVLEA